MAQTSHHHHRARRGTPHSVTTGRTYFRDVKPFDVPETLDELKGPKDGVIEVPHSILWAPGGTSVDLSEPGAVAMVYQAAISEGSASEQAALLNRDRLVEVWPDLMLPPRARELWAKKFPELRATASA